MSPYVVAAVGLVLISTVCTNGQILPPPQVFVSKEEQQNNDVVVYYNGNMLSLNALARSLNKTVTYSDLPFCSASCKGRCGKQERLLVNSCFCDLDCKHYGDCCFDIELRCTDHNKKQTKNKLDVSKSCVDANINDKNLGYIMVSRCPRKGLNKEIISSCEDEKQSDLLRRLPVFSISTNQTYKNVFCAKCNNITDFTYWRLEADCDGKEQDLFINQTFQDVIGGAKKYCELHYQPVRQQHEKFCVLQVDSCDKIDSAKQNPAWNTAKTLCKAYSYPTCLRSGRHSRNAHCRLCETAARTTTDIDCLCTSQGKTPDLSIIFDFSSKSQYTLKNEKGDEFFFKIETRNCETSQVYDPFTQTCRRSIATLRDNSVNNTKKNICSSNVLLMKSDFRLFPNGSIYVRNHNRLYRNSEYFILDNKAVLCINFTRTYTEKSTQQAPGKFESQEELAMELITYIGGGLSVLGLLMLLAVYSCFSKLRNLPGKIVMSLSGALLIYQVCFFLTGQYERRGVCSAVAIVLHYFLLASFTWMSIMAFDVAKTFTSEDAGAGSRSSSSQRRMFCKYCICGWGAPLVVVGVCLALDRTISDSIGYGSGAEYCWIAQRRALIFAFIVPVAVTLSFNFVALIITVSAIRKIQKATHRVTKQNNQRQLVFLTLKLFVILGLTWSLGFVSDFMETAFLRYPFIIINSMQGFLISLAFTFSKGVTGLIRTKTKGPTAPFGLRTSAATKMRRFEETRSIPLTPL